MSSNPTRIGYWHGLDSPGLPHPHEFADATWSASERGVVVAYLKSRKGRAVTAWRGFSHCRICGCTNGSEDISDGVYRWPSGYAHYIEAHDVRPPQAFIDHVMASREKEAGEKASRESMTEKQIVRHFMLSLNEGQLPAIALALQPEQLVMLMELHRIVTAEQEPSMKKEEVDNEA